MMGLIVAFAIVIALLAVRSPFDTPALLIVMLLVWIACVWALLYRTRRTPTAEWRRLIGVQLVGDLAIVMRQPPDGEAYELVAVHRSDDPLWASIEAFESFWLHRATIYSITLSSTSGEIVTLEVARIDPSALRLGLQDAGVEVRSFESRA